MKNQLEKGVCVLCILGLLIIGMGIPVSAESSYLVPELRHRDGTPAYAFPQYMVFSNVSSDAQTPDSHLVNSQPTSPPTDKYWSQFHNTLYKDGYASTDYKLASPSNSAAVSLTSYAHVIASPIVTPYVKMIINSYHAAFPSVKSAYNFDFTSGSSPDWSLADEGTPFTIASNGNLVNMYIWNIRVYYIDMLKYYCIDKINAMTGSIVTSGDYCWLAQTVNHFVDLTYAPIGPGNQEQKVYVLVDHVGTNPPSKLYAFEADSLTLRWATPLDNHVLYSSPTVLQRNSEPREIVLGDQTGKIYLMREDNGGVMASYSANAPIRYSPTIDRSYWGYVYFVTDTGRLYKFNLDNFGSLQLVWYIDLVGGVATQFTAPVNTGDWVFVRGSVESGGYYNRITMVKKQDHTIKLSDSIVNNNIDWNRISGRTIAPSIAVGNNYVFSTRVYKDASNNYWPGIEHFGYNSNGFVSGSYSSTKCSNSPSLTTAGFYEESSPAILYYTSTNKWLLYYTYWFYQDGYTPQVCKYPLGP